jgi:hypothetical protein
MSDYFPRRSACGQERPCAGPSPCLLMPERTSRPAQYRREAGQGLAALQNFNSAYAAQHVNDTLELPVMMGSGLGVRLYAHRAGPNLLRPDPRVIDRSLPLHTGRLWGVGIKRRRGDDSHAIMLPFGRLPVIMCVRHWKAPPFALICCA